MRESERVDCRASTGSSGGDSIQQVRCVAFRRGWNRVQRDADVPGWAWTSFIHSLGHVLIETRRPAEAVSDRRLVDVRYLDLLVGRCKRA